MRLGRKGNVQVTRRNLNEKPLSPVYSMAVPLNGGTILSLQNLKGRKILFVNTASDCGYTNQYEDLQKLYEQYRNKLTIIAFPANDFKHQEKGDDETIAQFCKANFNVQFPIAKKSKVIKGRDQNEVFQWLTQKERNGWNDEQPVWNFTKYLINEEGVLTHIFHPTVSPLSEEVLKAVTPGP
jgi:glutathione peroxidase